MQKIIKVLTVSAGLMTGVCAHAETKDACPADLVNFWKNFAVNTDNYSAIPEFLLRNECFRARVSTEFHTAMVNRFDNPDDPQYVDQLYAQLDWDKSSSALPVQ